MTTPDFALKLLSFLAFVIVFVALRIQFVSLSESVTFHCAPLAAQGTARYFSCVFNLTNDGFLALLRTTSVCKH